MKIVKVTYTTKAEYAEQNQRNIKLVMNDLRKSDHSGINYHVCVCADGKTFIHTAFFNSDEDERILLNLPPFKHFQEQLKSSGPEIAPKQELLNLVGSSEDMFNS